MRVHEFGIGNKQKLVFIHPSMVMWDYFSYVWPLLEQEYHIIVPALPGYDPEDKSEFTGVEKIASELEDWLQQNGHSEIACICGCSMGGAIINRMLADNRLDILSAVIDGGITPYRLPWLITRFIALKDFCMVSMGKLGGSRYWKRRSRLTSIPKKILNMWLRCSGM